ncbi:hypothetical protein [Streptococcus sciuri]|uniref:Uncharacterized protein n=1 Tax=Streptococcus sciuri TaxID=2973939 RepID=A0ABT2F8J7_9STRE|nr:hypothetical protein [Streptococcus sciuri]MCS4488518.1 hypothetical protein [Streptococcus sciuri]
MAARDVLNVLIAGKLYYLGDIDGFIKEHSTTNLQLRVKEGYSVASLDVSSFVIKSDVITESEIIFRDVTVDEIMKIISDNKDKSIIDCFNAAYPNLEVAYFNLLREKEVPPIFSIASKWEVNWNVSFLQIYYT